MEQQTIQKYNGKYLESDSMPRNGKKLVSAKSLFPKNNKNLASRTIAVFVKHAGNTYLVSVHELVPADCELLRDNRQNICGIPAVVGG